MPKPMLVIVGRPNVGKSSLFNRIAGSEAAIVEDVPGVTRDRNFMDAQWEGKTFTIVDTGGFFPPSEGDLHAEMKEQALFAIEEADLIIHLLDGKDGLNPYDRELAGVLRESGKKVLWAVNKIDAPSREPRLHDFYALGVDLHSVSAATGYNFEELMEKAVSLLPPARKEARLEYPKIAVVGRPNTGKSTLVNSLLGRKRMVVSPVPGTTRDSVDSVCAYERKKYLLIDTAGIKRKARTGYSIERFAMVRAVRSIERCDVCTVLLDATAGVTAEDQRIAGTVLKYGKGAVFLLNKWDLVAEPEPEMKRLREEFNRKLWFFSHAPVLTTSGLERKRIAKIFPKIEEVMAERKKRIGTPELNRFIKGLSPPFRKGKKVRFLYMAQVGIEPPSFTLFTNLPASVNDSSLRYIEARLREKYSFAGTPVRIYVKKS